MLREKAPRMVVYVQVRRSSKAMRKPPTHRACVRTCTLPLDVGPRSCVHGRAHVRKCPCTCAPTAAGRSGRGTHGWRRGTFASYCRADGGERARSPEKGGDGTKSVGERKESGRRGKERGKKRERSEDGARGNVGERATAATRPWLPCARGWRAPVHGLRLTARGRTRFGAGRCSPRGGACRAPGARSPPRRTGTAPARPP